MATYAEMKTRVADELRRSDLTTHIPNTILRAIKFYSQMPLWFNETSTDLTATVSQAYVAVPSDFLFEDSFFITISGYDSRMIAADYSELIASRPSGNAQPTRYSYYQNRMELDCKSDSAYSMPLKYIKELTALSADGDTNSWTTDGEDLIIFRSCKMLCSGMVNDQRRAATYGFLERDALNGLRGLRDEKVMTGRITPTRF